MPFLVKVSDLVNYAGYGSRKYGEGECVADANHIIFCGITSVLPKKIEIAFLCLKSSDLFGSPDEVNVIIKIENNEKKILYKFSCKAGLSGKCKHCIAALIYLLRTDKSNIEMATCTDLKQEWGKLKPSAKEMYGTIPVTKYFHGSQEEEGNYRVPQLLEEHFNVIEDMLYKSNASTVHGVKAESKARECYERQTKNIVVQYGLLVNPLVPWLGYGPDGIVFGEYIIEIKCPVEGKKKCAADVVASLKWVVKTNGALSLKQNDKYYCQVQLGMFVSNTKKCHFIIYSTFNDSCVVFDVLYNKNLITNYIPKLKFVYFNYMLNQIVSVIKTKKVVEESGNKALDRKALQDISNK